MSIIVKRLVLFNLLVTLITSNIFSQVHFAKSKTPTYKVVNITYGVKDVDTSIINTVVFKHIRGLNGISIVLHELYRDSLEIVIYKKNKKLQRILLPYGLAFIEEDCKVADLDNNKLPDIKFIVYGSGSGLAGELCTKIYLFNYGNKFKLLSFFDFSHEKEYDLNNDSVFEILSCNHLFYKDHHSYWVYNAFDFKKGKLLNISKDLNYPLFTRHLNRSRNKVANSIPYKERIKQYKSQPDETIIK